MVAYVIKLKEDLYVKNYKPWFNEIIMTSDISEAYIDANLKDIREALDVIKEDTPQKDAKLMKVSVTVKEEGEVK